MQTTSLPYAEATNFSWHSQMQNLGQGLQHPYDRQLGTNLVSSNVQNAPFQGTSNVAVTSSAASNVDPIVANTMRQENLGDQSGLKGQKVSWADQQIDQKQQLQTQTSKQFQPSTAQVNAPLTSPAVAPTSFASTAAVAPTSYTSTSVLPAYSYLSYPIAYPTSTMVEDKIIEIYYPPTQRKSRGLFGRRKKGAAQTGWEGVPPQPAWGGFGSQPGWAGYGSSLPFGQSNLGANTLRTVSTTYPQYYMNPMAPAAPMSSFHAPLRAV